ncbi:MAG: hypothetical protein MSH35_08510, partial [Lactobacillus amylovorus]|nr:hypothetical protein [Lactobacillus amylovorus]
KKYGANKKVKPSNFHFKNKKHRNSLKIMNSCVFISGLKIEFFPRHFCFWKGKYGKRIGSRRWRNAGTFYCRRARRVNGK